MKSVKYMDSSTNPNSNAAFRLEGGRHQLMMSLFPDYRGGLERYDEPVPAWRGSRRYSRQAALMARVSAPYVIKRDSSIGGKLIVLNREYKPIGCGGRAWGDGCHAHYPDFQDAIIDPWPELVEWMRENLDEVHEDANWYFYNDLNPPWEGRDYAEALVRKIEGLIDQVAPGWLEPMTRPLP